MTRWAVWFVSSLAWSFLSLATLCLAAFFAARSAFLALVPLRGAFWSESLTDGLLGFIPSVCHYPRGGARSPDFKLGHYPLAGAQLVLRWWRDDRKEVLVSSVRLVLFWLICCVCVLGQEIQYSGGTSGIDTPEAVFSPAARIIPITLPLPIYRGLPLAPGHAALSTK